MTHLGWLVSGLLIGGGFGAIVGWHVAIKVAVGEASDVLTLVEASNAQPLGEVEGLPGEGR